MLSGQAKAMGIHPSQQLENINLEKINLDLLLRMKVDQLQGLAEKLGAGESDDKHELINNILAAIEVSAAADEDPLTKLSFEELKAKAAELEIEVEGRQSKKAFIDAITLHLNK